ncbi:aminoacyl-tRNA hydrolase [Candidatus Dojkabacteria bacterium]|nr:aminoacyl-tRNA hydrolase [Candidatus Dojkabacteria bacterium]
MKLIVGLGNPGKEYEKTRHNVGFMFIEDFTRQKDARKKWRKKDNYEFIKFGDLVVCKPLTFMNESGNAVRKIADFYKISPESIVVAHDDLDIPLGNYKLQKDKGPKVHNGIASVENSLETTEFWRLRLGIENREHKIAGKDYVLNRFTKAEEIVILETIQTILVNEDL